MDDTIKEIIYKDKELKKIVKFVENPIQEIPNRIKNIKKILDQYIPNKNELHNINIRRLFDKYYDELKNFKYVDNYKGLTIGQNIIFVSRKTDKISKLMEIIDFKKNESNEMVGIFVKSKRARNKKYISFLKNYIFELKQSNNNDLRNILEDIIY